MEETPPPNPERNTGKKPKPFFQKNKRWNIMNQRENQHTQHFKNKEKHDNNEHIDKLKKEISRLTEVNERYEDDYQKEKKILMFNLYEKQYLLQTKTAYLESQSDLISNISAENQNLQNIIRTYTMRMDGNNTYIQKLIDGTKNMQTHVNTLREDAKKICDSMEFLDSKRQEIAT